jgi:hypothetical protein
VEEEISVLGLTNLARTGLKRCFKMTNFTPILKDQRRSLAFIMDRKRSEFMMEDSISLQMNSASAIMMRIMIQSSFHQEFLIKISKRQNSTDKSNLEMRLKR